MTSNRSYMMSNVSRRRRRTQRRNVAIAVIVVASLIGLGVYALSGPGKDAAPPLNGPVASNATDTGAPSPQQPRGGTNLLGPSTASAAITSPTPTRPAALPDPEPIVKNESPREVANDAVVLEMGRPVGDSSSNTNRNASQANATKPAETPTRSAPTGVIPVSTGSAIADLLARADTLEAQNKPLEARNILNGALFDRSTTQAERAALRARLTRLNETLVFSRTVVPGDPLVKSYTIAPGDSLAKIASSEKLDTDWRLIAQINGINDPRRIRVGQSLKLVKGPYHAVVYKGEFRLDLFANATDSAGNRLYVRSFPVGLGEFGSTPVGSFVVRPSSKLVNPVWTNPRTGEYFGADNPANPIGEHWIGLDPADDASSAYTQYGLHGTIEPESIGTEKSMGCVRLASPDIELLYGLLVESKSTVEILP
jgi:LysM repeat protein